MDNTLLINEIFVFLNVAVGCFLALWVLLANPKEKLNQIFSLMTVLMLFWVVFAFFGFFSKETEKALIFYRLNWGIVVLFFVTSYFFSIYFPKKITENRFLSKFVVVLCSLLFLVSVFSNLIISGVAEKEWGMEIIFGKGKLFYYVPIIILTLLILYNLFKKYFVLTKQERLKIQYVLIGITIFALANLIFNIGFTLLTDSVQFQHFGDYSVIIFLGFTAYAIVKRQLFEIKVVLTALLVGVIAILLGIDALIFTEKLFFQIVKGGILAVFLFFGYLLVRSVLKEIKYREEIARAYEVEKRAREIEKENRKKAEKLAQEFQRLDKTKDQFILATQHHLRTPLTGMMGYASLLLEGYYGKLRPKAEEAITKFLNSTVRLIKIVNELLDISQFRLGKKVVNLQPGIKLKPIFKEIIEELKTETENKGIYLKLEIPKSLPIIKADSNKLKVALFNLIDNGIKYTKKGGVTIKIQIADSKLQIIIQDTGLGIAKEELKNLFTRTFERGEEAKRVHGTGRGIGLYIAAKIVEAHQGRVWAESEGRGKGSTFYVELPVG